MPDPAAVQRLTLILGGISLAGKSTLARSLLGKLPPAIPFIEGDDLHPPANRAKMAAGVPLTEADRYPWRNELCARIGGTSRHPLQVLTCSSLRREFRQALRAAGPVRFVLLTLPPALAEERARLRLEQEPDHYFQPVRHPELLRAQYRDFEAPENEPDARVFPVANYASPDELADAILTWIGASLPHLPLLRPRRPPPEGSRE